MNLRGMLVLVVEDDPLNRELLTEILLYCGAEVMAAESVAQAMDLLRGRRPSAIVSDISMPVEDGYSLMRRLQAGGLNIPSVAITAHRYEHTRERTLAAGFREHLTKPVEPELLCDTVATAAEARG
jgi:CheY-like chemotaxis protein